MSSLRQALRSLRRSPGFALTVVVSLGLGIGACTAVFTVVNAFLFAPLPYPDADRLVEISATMSPSTERLAGDRFQRERVNRWIEQGVRSLDALAWEDVTTLSLDLDGSVERVKARVVSGDWFSTLGIDAIRGRSLATSDDLPGAAPAVVVSERFWAERMGSGSDVLGRTLRLSESTYTIVGVASKRIERDRAVWVASESLEEQRRPFIVGPVGRLARGVTIADLNRELRELTANEVAADSIATAGYGANATPIGAMARRTDRGGLWLGLGLAGGALVMALTNLATLFLIRSSKRAQGAAVRVALGAGAWQLSRGLLIEGLLLGVVSAGLGLALAVGGQEAMLRVMGSYTLPYAPPFDWRVFGFAITVSIASTVLLSLGPVRALGRVDVRSVLQRVGAGSAGTRRDVLVRHGIVAVQIAMALLVGLSAVFTTLRSKQYFAFGLGYDPQRTIVARLDYETSDISRESWADLGAQVVGRLKGRPGVAGAGAWYQGARAYPLDPRDRARIEGYEGTQGPARYYAVTPGFAGFLGVPVVRGRDFTAADDRGSDAVVIVSEGAAKLWWPGQEAIGKHIQLGQSGTPAIVVGIVGDIAGLDDTGRLFSVQRAVIGRGHENLYLPLAQTLSPPSGWNESACSGCSGLEFGVRASGAGSDAEQSLSAVVVATLPDVPLKVLGSLADRQASYFGGRQIIANRRIAGVTSAVVVIIALLGVIGAVTDQVTKRTREVGLRLALGATTPRVVLTVSRDSVITAVVGLAVGVAAALLLRNVIWKALDPIPLPASQLRPTNAPLLGIAVAGVFTLTIVASLLAAHRASRISPAEALRYE
jgi:putative ABC transport system permease protein